LGNGNGKSFIQERVRGWLNLHNAVAGGAGALQFDVDLPGAQTGQLAGRLGGFDIQRLELF